MARGPAERRCGAIRIYGPTVASICSAIARFVSRSFPQTTTSSPATRLATAVATSISAPRITAPDGPAARVASWMVATGVGGCGAGLLIAASVIRRADTPCMIPVRRGSRHCLHPPLADNLLRGHGDPHDDPETRH